MQSRYPGLDWDDENYRQGFKNMDSDKGGAIEFKELV